MARQVKSNSPGWRNDENREAVKRKGRRSKCQAEQRKVQEQHHTSCACSLALETRAKQGSIWNCFSWYKVSWWNKLIEKAVGISKNCARLLPYDIFDGRKYYDEFDSATKTM